MQRTAAAVIMLGLTMLGGLVAADLPARSAEPAGDEAKARDFVRICFEQHDLKAAFDKYVAPDLIEHDPEFGDGRDSVFRYIEQRHAAHPDEYLPTDQWKTDMDQVLFTDGILITKMHVFSRKNDRGRVFADFWRFQGGKIVEHWDVIQEVPAEKANPRPMW